jgi:hypothetical protein
MTQQLFEDLTADAPASTIDVPGIVRRERRRRVGLRAGGSAVAVLAVASTVAILSPGRAPAPAPSAVAVRPPAASAAATPATGFRLVADNRAATVATAKTLRAALDAAVHQVAPGATWLKQSAITPPTPDGQPPRIVGDDQKNPTDQMFSGATGITVGGRRGTLALGIISIDPCTGGKLAKCPPAGQTMTEGLFACQPAAPKCTASTGPDGRRRRVQTSVSLYGFASQETNVELADGRTLMLTVDNQFIVPGSGDQDHVAQRATPLSPAQVTAIATRIGDQIRP